MNIHVSLTIGRIDLELCNQSIHLNGAVEKDALARWKAMDYSGIIATHWMDRQLGRSVVICKWVNHTCSKGERLHARLCTPA